MTEDTVYFSPRTSLAVVPLAHQDMAIALIVGYVSWLVVIWFAKPRPSVFGEVLAQSLLDDLTQSQEAELASGLPLRPDAELIIRRPIAE